jgi:3-methyladenine DNA glycosylase AlkC
MIQILSYCDSKQINSILDYSITQLKKKDWSNDAHLSNLLPILEDKNDDLSLAMGEIRKSPYTEKLLTCDGIFDKRWNALKAFVYANELHQNESIAQNAKELKKLMSAHQLNLHRLPYAKEIAAAEAFFADTDTQEWSTKINTLVGVAEQITSMKNACSEMKNLYYKSITEKANHEKMESPSVLKKEIRTLLNNKLLLYLNTMTMVNTELYGEIYKSITEYVEEQNDKARISSKKKTKLDV